MLLREARVVKLVNAPDLKSDGPRGLAGSKPVSGTTDKHFFEIRSVAQSGSAPGLGPGGRRFKSDRSDQIPK